MGSERCIRDGVACARALVGRPAIIFGEEPTGNLDSRSSAEVMSILRAATDEFGQTVVIVTHDPRAASFADRVVFLGRRDRQDGGMGDMVEVDLTDGDLSTDLEARVEDEVVF